MIPTLYLSFVILGTLAIGLAVSAKGAIHEGVAAILLLGSIACLIGAGICSRLDKIHHAMGTPPPLAPGADGKMIAIFFGVGILAVLVIVAAIKISSSDFAY